jgi:hypothetical protein
MADLEGHTDRRRLLRRAGTLAAGMAGAGVAGAVAATPAQAADEGPMKIEIHSPNTPALELRNTFEVPETHEAGPALRLVPLGDSLYREAPAGSLSADRFGIPWVAVQHPHG